MIAIGRFFGLELTACKIPNILGFGNLFKCRNALEDVRVLFAQMTRGIQAIARALGIVTIGGKEATDVPMVPS